MNQLELFPQERISIGAHPRRQIVCFEFEKKKAWSNYWEIDSIRIIFQEGGAVEFQYIYDATYCNQLFSHIFSCDGGTWERLIRKSEFRFVSSWEPHLFHVAVA